MDIHKNDDTIKSAFWKQLKQPAPAAIAKQRKIQKKKPPKGKAGSARVKRVGKRSADVAAGALKKRLHEFAGHTLFILSCCCCRIAWQEAPQYHCTPQPVPNTCEKRPQDS